MIATHELRRKQFLSLSERSFMDGGRVTSVTQKGKVSSFVETNLVILSQCQSNMDHKTGYYRLIGLIKLREKIKSFREKYFREH